LTTLDEYRAFTTAIGEHVPVLANITEFGKTPLFTVEELRGTGVRLVLYPLSAFRAMSKAALAVYETLRKQGRSRMSPISCRRAPSFTKSSAITPTRRNSTLSFPNKKPPTSHERNRRRHSFQTQEISRALRRPAGNTALCSVGRSGNDLHYRGYDILDLAANCEFEEVAHLIVHGKLPTAVELAAYKTKLRSLRGLPAAVRGVLEALPAASHPMDVLRTASRHSAARCRKRKGTTQRVRATSPTGSRIAELDAALLVSLLAQRSAHRSRDRRRFHRRAFPPPAARQGTQCIVVKAMHTSLNLYAEQ